MSAAGRIECTSATSGFTLNQEYDILGFAVDPGINVLAITLDDNSEFRAVDPNSASFQVNELYAGKKLI